MCDGATKEDRQGGGVRVRVARRTHVATGRKEDRAAQAGRVGVGLHGCPPITRGWLRVRQGPEAVGVSQGTQHNETVERVVGGGINE